jgi:prepilin-type N-terminal cleavage/methylation domain-containing protein
MKTTAPSCISPRRRGFTLIEMLAAVTIIGIMVFLAIPNITAVRRDAEENMATSKVSMLNVALASYIQGVGIAKAKQDFLDIANGSGTASAKNTSRFLLLRPYLAYAPATMAAYMPSGFTVTLPTVLDPLNKAQLFRPSGTEIYY